MQIYACIHLPHLRGRGWFEIFFISCNFFLLCWENVGKINKNQYSLKMYITMKYQFIWMTKILCGLPAINHPSQCSKPLKTWRLPQTISCCWIGCCAGFFKRVFSFCVAYTKCIATLWRHQIYFFVHKSRAPVTWSIVYLWVSHLGCKRALK